MSLERAALEEKEEEEEEEEEEEAIGLADEDAELLREKSAELLEEKARDAPRCKFRMGADMMCQYDLKPRSMVMTGDV